MEAERILELRAEASGEDPRYRTARKYINECLDEIVRLQAILPVLVPVVDLRGDPEAAFTPEAMARLAEDSYGEPSVHVGMTAADFRVADEKAALRQAKRLEKDDALLIAERVLDRVNADPDDDLAVLARQTKRAAELRVELKGVMTDLQFVQHDRDAWRAQTIVHEEELHTLRLAVAGWKGSSAVMVGRILTLEEEQMLNERKLIRCTIAMREVAADLLVGAGFLPTSHADAGFAKIVELAHTLPRLAKKLSDARHAKAECGPDCPQCSGKACVRCEHDVIERHTRPKG